MANGGGDGHNKKPDGPPDLDEMVSKLRQQIAAALGGKKGPKQFSNESKGIGSFGIGLVFLIIVLIWALSGIFIVSPPEESVILLFGKYTQTVGPGIHWIPRFFESEYTINVQQISTFSYQAEMLTKDENIVSVAVAIQYQVTDPYNYLFNVINADESLRQATAATLRQVIGQTRLDEILTTGRSKVRDEIADNLNKILAQYKIGITITDVTLQPAKPPEQVTAAFDDAIKAREDEQRYINKAYAYAQKIVPIAQGQAARILQEAEANQKQLVLKAQALTASYLALLPEYEKSPQVTRERLYLTTIESVLQRSSKVLVDVKGANNMMYLPLDKLLSQDQKLSAKLPAPSISTESTANSKGEGSTNADSVVLSRPLYPSSRYYPGEAQ